MEIRLLARENNKSYVGEFLGTVAATDKKAFLFVSDRIMSLRDNPLGQLLAAEQVKKVRDGLYELRVKFRGMCYRILFIIKEAICWLLHAIVKKTDKLPPNDIKTALDRAKLVPSKNFTTI